MGLQTLTASPGKWATLVAGRATCRSSATQVAHYCRRPGLYGQAFASENKRVNTWSRTAAGLMVLMASAAKLFASGSGLNIVVVVNQNSTNSVQLGNYYCEKRNVPPQNLLRISWSGGTLTWTKSDFETFLQAPLNSMLASQQLTNQIDYVLLSMDIPYRVSETGLLPFSGTDSTTSSLYYGF